jgi:hypothetical protein
MYRTVVAALALALGVASCGTDEVRITAAQFAPRLTAICAQAHVVAHAEVRKQRNAAHDPRALAATLMAGGRYIVDRLDEIAPPPAMRRDFDLFKQEMHARLAMFERIHAAQGANVQQVAAASAHEQVATFERLDAISHRYGIHGCV